ncbi:MAG: class I SAM-dependent methyltransferase [Oscillospiraceae bacterium]|jgi:SAM-dependent methyltransferase|nr:class I SAM-dependent methyltransferase [Oscillospiraceae bacterium]
MLTSEWKEVLFWKDWDDYARFVADWEAAHPDREPDPRRKARRDAENPSRAADPETAAQWEADFGAWQAARVPNKAALLARFADYAANGKPQPGIPLRQGKEALAQAMEFATTEAGQARALWLLKVARSWAFHLDDYAAAVNVARGQTILELSVGAGLGTRQVMETLRDGSTLISVDCDFVCVANALGLAGSYMLKGRAAGITANFWDLPFGDATFDTVCSHYGLDESRELPTTLREAARVLRPGGRFVAVARQDPWDRHGPRLEHFGVTRDECRELLRSVRLYSGPEDLIGTAAACGLFLTQRKTYEPAQGHHRVLLSFEKK